ncbi:MAG: DUF4131 domain-containing protein [Alphaproteobacteria bacterium]
MYAEPEVRLEPRGGGPVRRLARAFAAERERWPLWVPVGIGGGVAGYFVLPFEPAAAWAPALLIAALCLGCIGYRRLRKSGRGEAMVIVAFLLGAPALGFTAIEVESYRLAAPVLKARLGPVLVRGRIVAQEPGIKGVRLTVAVSAIDRLAPAEEPARVRIRVRPSLAPVGGQTFTNGAEIRVLAILMPPPPPAVPGGFDFARSAWFKGIGAVGFAVRAPELAQGGAPSGWLAALRGAIGDLRATLFRRITQALPGAAGGIAAALMTGERSAVISC